MGRWRGKLIEEWKARYICMTLRMYTAYPQVYKQTKREKNLVEVRIIDLHHFNTANDRPVPLFIERISFE